MVDERVQNAGRGHICEGHRHQEARKEKTSEGKFIKREDYAVRMDVLQILLIAMERERDSGIDAFSSDKNARFDEHWTEQENALQQDWSRCVSSFLWLNPPFSLWDIVARKILESAVWCIACVPDWGENYVDDLLSVTVNKFYIPSGSMVFELDGVPVGPTQWGLWILEIHKKRRPREVWNLYKNVTIIPLNKKGVDRISKSKRGRNRRATLQRNSCTAPSESWSQVC